MTKDKAEKCIFKGGQLFGFRVAPAMSQRAQIAEPYELFAMRLASQRPGGPKCRALRAFSPLVFTSAAQSSQLPNPSSFLAVCSPPRRPSGPNRRTLQAFSPHALPAGAPVVPVAEPCKLFGHRAPQCVQKSNRVQHFGLNGVPEPEILIHNDKKRGLPYISPS